MPASGRRRLPLHFQDLPATGLQERLESRLTAELIFRVLKQGFFEGYFNACKTGKKAGHGFQQMRIGAFPFQFLDGIPDIVGETPAENREFPSQIRGHVGQTRECVWKATGTSFQGI